MRWTCRPERAPARQRSLRCESLERRLLLSGTPGPDLPIEPPGLGRLAAAFREASSRSHAEMAPARMVRLIDADFDGDGCPDRAELVQVPGARVDSLLLWRGRPEGGLDPRQRFSLGEVAGSLLADDLDRDGVLDLFVNGLELDRGTLLLGRGDGDFDPYHRDASEASLAVADLTGDGLNDLIFTDPEASQIRVRYGHGAAQQLSAGALELLGPRSMQLADLNGDGVLDLVVADASRRVLMFPGLEDGTFGAEVSGGTGLTAGWMPAQVTVAYLGDRQVIDPETGIAFDPHPDLLITNRGSDSVSVFFGLGGWQMEYGGEVRTGMAPTSTTVGDVDGDGASDLVVTNGGSDSVWIIPGDGHGRFGAAPHVLPSGPKPIAAFLNHFDDGLGIDLVTLNAGNDTLSYFSAVWTATAATATLASGGQGLSAGLLGDVNADDRSDLIVAHQGAEGAISLFLGSSAGLLWSQTVSGVTAAALAATPDDPLTVYALDAGATEASLVIFVLADSPDLDLPTPVDDTGWTPTAEGVPAVLFLPLMVQMLPLSAASLDSVPMLVISPDDTLPPETLAERRERLRQPLWGATDDTLDGEEEAVVEAPREPTPTGGDDALQLQRYILGLDEVPPPPLGAEGLPVQRPTVADGPLPLPGALLPAEPPPEAPPLAPLVPAGMEEPSEEEPVSLVAQTEDQDALLLMLLALCAPGSRAVGQRAGRRSRGPRFATTRLS